MRYDELEDAAKVVAEILLEGEPFAPMPDGPVMSRSRQIVHALRGRWEEPTAQYRGEAERAQQRVELLESRAAALIEMLGYHHLPLIEVSRAIDKAIQYAKPKEMRDGFSTWVRAELKRLFDG